MWFTLCQFHSRWHSLHITLKSTTLVCIRSRNVWNTKPWQRSYSDVWALTAYRGKLIETSSNGCSLFRATIMLSRKNTFTCITAILAGIRRASLTFNILTLSSDTTKCFLPYFGKRKQVTYHRNLSYWCFHILPNNSSSSRQNSMHKHSSS